MASLDRELGQLVMRYRGEVRELGNALRTLPPTERVAARTHLNVKEACANELQRMLDRAKWTAGVPAR